jgi:hypothetical protein
VCRGDDLTTFIVPKVEKIRNLNLPGPEGPVRPVAEKLYVLVVVVVVVVVVAHPTLKRYTILGVAERVTGGCHFY